MTALSSASESVPVRAGTRTGLGAWDDEPPGLAGGRDAGLADTCGEKPFEALARLVALVLGTPSAYITVGAECAGGARQLGARNIASLEGRIGRSLRQHVLDSGHRLIIDDT